MKNLIFTLRQQVLVLVTLLAGMQAYAQSLDVADGIATLEITAAGQISAAITGYAGDKTAIKELIVTGTFTATTSPVNNTDFTAIKSSLTAIERVDWSGIVATNATLGFPNSALTDSPIKSFAFPQVKAMTLGRAAFQNTQLTGTFTLPKTLVGAASNSAITTNFSDNNFTNTPKITDFALENDPDDIAKIKIIDGIVFSKTSDTLALYPAGNTRTSYVIPEGVKFISTQAFVYTTSLKDLTLPSTLPVIDPSDANERYLNSRFLGGTLENIYVTQGNPTYYSHNGLLCKITDTNPFTYGLFYCPLGVKNAIIENPITTIPNGFFGVSRTLLESVTFGETVTNIGSTALKQVPNLKQIICLNPSAIVTLGSDNGFTAQSGLRIGVPATLVNTYKTASGWSTLSSYIKPVYKITTTDAIASGTYGKTIAAFVDDVITITAAPAPAGKKFNKWTTTSGVTFIDEESTTTTFTMLASDVTVTATYTDATGIQDVKSAKLALYPNPATDYIQLSDVENANYAIYSIVGKLVSQGITNGEAISVSDLSNGVYIFKAEGKALQFIKK